MLSASAQLLGSISESSGALTSAMVRLPAPVRKQHDLIVPSRDLTDIEFAEREILAVQIVTVKQLVRYKYIPQLP
jgi:hypothetical protein